MLSPLSHKKRKGDVKGVVGPAVREFAKITGKELDWKQKLKQIGDIIKNLLRKICDNNKTQTSFNNILKDENLRRNLEKLNMYNMKPTTKAHSSTTLPHIHKNNKGSQIG